MSPRNRAVICGAVALAALVMLAPGCSFLLSDRTVTVSIPSVPAEWSPFVGTIEVEYWYRGRPIVEKVTPGAASHDIVICKQGFSPVLAYAVGADGTSRFLPAGAVFPWSINGDGVLETSWQDGPLAFILYRLCRSGFQESGVNVARLREELWERSEGDPWEVDLDRIVAALAAGSFRADWIRLRPRFPAVVRVSQEWLNAGGGDGLLTRDALRPLQPVDVSIEGEKLSLDLGDLPTGLHRFYRFDTSGILDVQIDEAGTVAWVTMPAEL